MPSRRILVAIGAILALAGGLLVLTAVQTRLGSFLLASGTLTLLAVALGNWWEGQ